MIESGNTTDGGRAIARVASTRTVRHVSNTLPASTLPVAVIGAGPIGLAAAAQLLARGERPLVLEAGDAVGASIRAWSHVRLFSPWKYLVDPAARALLAASGWAEPDGDALPTGGDFLADYLEPLAALPALAPHVLTGRRVTAVSRRGFDKVKSAGRQSAPFELVVTTAAGGIERYAARAVIDASGTYTSPNPLGANGLPLDGEAELKAFVHHGIPDVTGADRGMYAGRRTLVIGSGHSAFNTILALAELAAEGEAEAAGTEVIWAIRRETPGQLFGGGARDALPARGSLGERLRKLVDAGAVRLVTGFNAERLERRGGGIVIEGAGERTIGPVDRIVVTTGYRPELGMLRELRVKLDPWLEAPEALAPLIDPNVHSCGTVYPHGYEELRHPEPDFFIAGMKSYGRAPTFLLLTGYEQVRSVVCGLTGDLEGAREVRLVLPETGVCSTDPGPSACCGQSPGPIGGSCGIATPCASPAAVGAAESTGNPAAAGAPRVAAAGCCG